MRPVNHSHLSGLTLALTRLLLQRTGCINGLLTPLWERVILASSWWPSLSCIEIIPEHGLRNHTAPNFKKINETFVGLSSQNLQQKNGQGSRRLLVFQCLKFNLHSDDSNPWHEFLSCMCVSSGGRGGCFCVCEIRTIKYKPSFYIV